MMDVTQTIQQSHLKYGGQPNSIKDSIAASKSLNFADGATLTKPKRGGVISQIPYRINYQGTVGLFGSENQYLEFQTNILDIGNEFAVENTYITARAYEGGDLDTHYDPAIMNNALDPITVNTYLPALVTDDLAGIKRPVFSVQVVDKSSGNPYEDCWLDVTLFDRNKKQMPNVPGLVIRPNDKFYIGFSARNTKRLNYNVEVIIGAFFADEYSLTDDQRREYLY